MCKQSDTKVPPLRQGRSAIKGFRDRKLSISQLSVDISTQTYFNMYKLVVLFALVAVAYSAPAPGLLAAPLAYSSVVGHVPTSISHSSSSVIHSAAIATPVVHAAPIAYAAAPAVVAHHTYAAPAVVAHHGYAAAPLISTVHGVHHGVHAVHHGGLFF